MHVYLHEILYGLGYSIRGVHTYHVFMVKAGVGVMVRRIITRTWVRVRVYKVWNGVRIRIRSEFNSINRNVCAYIYAAGSLRFRIMDRFYG